MIGIIGAMDEEIALLKESIKIESVEICAGMEYIRGTIDDIPLVLLKAGIGKVNAAIGTQIMIDRFPVKEIIFSGLAGTLVPNLSRGDMVVSNYTVQYDFDLTAFGRRHGEIPELGRMLEADPRLVKLLCFAYDDYHKFESKKPRLQVGTIASGDRFVSDPRKIEWLQREFGAIATEMEGAAFGYTCHLNGIPYAILRTISDNSGSDAVEEFETFLAIASRNSFQILKSFMQSESHKLNAAK